MNKRYILCVLVISLVVFAPNIINAQVGSYRAFGGKITMMETCNDGYLLTVREFTGVQQFFWPYGKLKYLMFSPPHVNQYLLGMASRFPTTCELGEEYVGQGLRISFHGESL